MLRSWKKDRVIRRSSYPTSSYAASTVNDLLSVIDIVVNLPYLTVCDDTKVIDHGTDWGHNNLMIIELLNNIIYYYLSTQFKLDRSRVSLNLKFS